MITSHDPTTACCDAGDADAGVWKMKVGDRTAQLPLVDLLPEKIDRAIMRMQEFEPPEGYWLGFSGGKDSVVLLDLAIKSGCKFDAHHTITTIDPPELVQFVKTFKPLVKIDLPKRNFWQAMMPNHCLPTRLRRWCCGEFKEKGGTGRFILTGIRANESSERAARSYVENCYNRPNTKFLHPIFEWTSAEIWRYIHENNLAYCKLYNEGWERVGCLFCPNAPIWERKMHAARYPRYVKLFKKYITLAVNFDKRITETTVEEYWQWYLNQ